jgi:hypothetical protein
MVLFAGPVAWATPTETSASDAVQLEWLPELSEAAALQAGSGSCPGELLGELLVDFGASLEMQLANGSPCCRAACEAVCGVGERCVCHQCQVFGCEL